MAYDDDDFEEQEVQGERPPLDPNIRKQLREAEKDRKELAALRQELERERREVLFSKAGVPDDGIGKFFRKGYDGEATLEAIRSSYAEISGPPPETQVDVSSELAALQRTQGATIGNSGAMPDPEQEYYAALAAADDPKAVMAIIRGESGKKLGIYAAGEQFT